MNAKIAQELNNTIASLEAFIAQKEERNKYDKIIEMLTVALADEWLAAYQYWVCKNLVHGEGRSDVVPEFEQHYEDELEHVDKIMKRIKELGGNPIPNPKDWLDIANPWEEVKTSSAEEQLEITIKAEQDAVNYYNEIIQFCKDTDEITTCLCREILIDETEHLYDLQMLKEQVCD